MPHVFRTDDRLLGVGGGRFSLMIGRLDRCCTISSRRGDDSKVRVSQVWEDGAACAARRVSSGYGPSWGCAI